MTYLTIHAGAASPARRVDFGRFAELFAEPEPLPPAHPRRSLARLVAAPLLLAALAVNLAVMARPTALAAEPRPPCAFTPS